MGKLIFWLVVVFAVLFALRLWNASKARRKNGAGSSSKSKPPQTGVMVRCTRCGVFLPRADALPSPNGFTCGDPACVSKSA